MWLHLSGLLRVVLAPPKGVELPISRDRIERPQCSRASRRGAGLIKLLELKLARRQHPDIDRGVALD